MFVFNGFNSWLVTQLYNEYVTTHDNINLIFNSDLHV